MPRRSPLSPGTYVWVKAPDDGLWWPAVVVQPTVELAEVMGEDLDVCVRLFHSADDIHPLNSHDKTSVRRLHWDQPDDKKFHQAAVLDAVSAARSAFQQTLSNKDARTPLTLPDNAAASEHRSSNKRHREVLDRPDTDVDTDLPYTEAELKKIAGYLSALGGDAAAQLKASLSLQAPPVVTRPRKVQAVPQTGAPAPYSEPSCSTPALPTPVPAAGPVISPIDISKDASVEQEILDEDSLDVLRAAVFQNSDVVGLDPTLKFVELLGAVAVPSDNRSFTAFLPNRRAVFSSPHRNADRVVIVPVGSDYDTSLGWLEATQWDNGSVLEMSVYVNNQLVAVPRNWSLAASKQATARRTFVPMDITDIIECTLPDEEGFQLRVVFSHRVEDVILWDAILAVVLVEAVPLETICSSLRSNYVSHAAAENTHRPGATRNDVPRCEASEVAVRCPLTSVLLRYPCRSVHCEHLQCFELEAAVQQCSQRHVWNCPLCGVSMLVSEIFVDHALMEVLRQINVQQVESAVFNESTRRYSAKYKQAVPRRTISDLTVVDE